MSDVTTILSQIEQGEPHRASRRHTDVTKHVALTRSGPVVRAPLFRLSPLTQWGDCWKLHRSVTRLSIAECADYAFRVVDSHGFAFKFLTTAVRNLQVAFVAVVKLVNISGGNLSRFTDLDTVPGGRLVQLRRDRCAAGD